MTLLETLPGSTLRARHERPWLRAIRLAFLALLAAGGLTPCLEARPSGESPDLPVERSPRSATPSARFIENLGQWPSDVRFAAEIGGVVARGECGGLGFHAVEADGRGAYLRLVFEGIARMPEPRGVERLPGVHHYYIGNDPSRWHTNARAYSAIRYDGLYPGVDLVLRCEGARPKYDLILAPGVDPAILQARWIGASEVQAHGGTIALGIGSAAVHELPVIAWQTRADGATQSVEARWITSESGGLRLEWSELDPTLPLTIDPEIHWGTYLGATVPGGGTDGAARLARGPDDSTYVLGTAQLPSFPTTPGAYVHAGTDGRWATVARIRHSDGNAVYSAVIGGSTLENVSSMSVDGSGRALIVGWTLSADFPLTAGAFDSRLDTYRAAFLFRLSSDGSTLEFSTVFESAGPLATTEGMDCHAFEDGTSLFGGGFSGIPELTTTLPPIGTIPPPGTPAFWGGFVAKLDSTGSNLVWSRVIGDRAGVWELAVTSAGHIDLVGNVDWPTLPTTPGVFQPVKPHPTNTILFAMQLSGDGRDQRWSTFLGTADISEDTIPSDLQLDDFDVLTFGFSTDVRNFPTTPDAFQPTPPPWPGSFHGGGFVRLAPDGTHLVASTYVSDGIASLGGCTVDASGIISIVGQANFPPTPGSPDETQGPGSELTLGRMDPFLRRLTHLRYVGGPAPKIVQDLMVQNDRSLTIAGIVQPPGGLPTTPNSFQPDYPGSWTSGFAVTLELTVAGVTDVGAGTPACHGSIVTQALRGSASGAADFGLYCSGAPENARGVLLIGRSAPSPTTFGGATIHVDRTAGYRALRVRSNEFGYLETELPIPALPAGVAFTAQYVFQNSVACHGPGRLSSSNALRVVIQ